MQAGKNKKDTTIKWSPIFGDEDSLVYAITPFYLKNYIAQFETKGMEEAYEVSKLFLKSYVHSKDTFNVYRREVERFLQWLWRIKKLNLKEINRQCMMEYIEFVKRPPQSWMSVQHFPRFISKGGQHVINENWRPFICPKKDLDVGHNLTNNSIKILLASLSSYFGFLVQEKFLMLNPVQQMRQKSQLVMSFQSNRITRVLSAIQWLAVINSSEEMARKDSSYYRHYFILSMFYLLGIRISEISSDKHYCPMMSDFKCDAKERWWFQTVGKGNKFREIAVPDDMLDVFKKYRLSMGLTALPLSEESIPLVPKLKGTGGIGTRQIHKIVTECFSLGVNRLIRDNNKEEAEKLKLATPHWLRHTSISHDVEHRPLVHVQMDAGHSKISTTSDYVELDYEERYRSAQSKHLRLSQDKSFIENEGENHE